MGKSQSRGRGRPRKLQQEQEWIDKLRFLLICDAGEQIAQLISQINNSEGGIDRILRTELRLKNFTLDEQINFADRKRVSTYYEQHPELFGFKDFEEYIYRARIVHGCPNPSAIEIEEPTSIEDMVDESIDLALDYQEEVRFYERHIFEGIPMREHIGDIVSEHFYNQQDGEGKNFGERLRKIAVDTEPKDEGGRVDGLQDGGW